ncbi:MAG: YkgJ family cysteine cluster protein [Candidatus Marinimicrobia bacterium]|nr:YkgJ family cysteine cluster protein [Candidatus Neomarinimicrobiota bacterium]
MISEKPRKRFYADGLQFECTGCGDCCKFADGYVFITPLEIDVAAHFLNLTYKEFSETYTNEFQGHKVLKDKNDACVFFKDKQCTLYNVRPMQCRTFPFWSSNMKSLYRWKIVAEKCEGIGQGRLYTYEEIHTIKNNENETLAGPTVTECE